MKVKGVRLVALAVDGECKYCVKDAEDCPTEADSAAADAFFKKVTSL